MSDLIDRYVRDATRSLAPEARTARSAELRGRIEGRIAERASAGEPDAERATLIELGDPEILDAQAAGRPLHLIGPRYFLQWKRLLILLLSIAPAAVAFAVTLAYSIDGRSFAEILGGAIGTAVSVAVHLVVWVTVVFAVIERSSPGGPGTTWAPDRLAPSADRRPRIGEPIWAFVGTIAVALLLTWDQFIGYLPWDLWDGQRVPVINPALWPWSLVVVIGLGVLGALVELGAYLRRRWTVGHAIVGALLALAGGAIVLHLHLSGLLANPEFIRVLVHFAGAEPVHILGIIVTQVIVIVAFIDAAEGFWRLRRRPKGA